jgi:hypothetical protein
LDWAAHLADVSTNDLERLLLSSPDARDLLLRVLNTAGATDKLVCLSLSLADSAYDPTTQHVAWENAFVRSIDDLDRLHFELLRRFTRTANDLGLGDGSTEFDKPIEALNRVQVDMVTTDMPIVSSLLAVLERQGLVGFDGLYYRITDFGTDVLTRLVEVGDLLMAARRQPGHKLRASTSPSLSQVHQAISRCGHEPDGSLSFAAACT